MKAGKNGWVQLQIDHFGGEDIAQFLGIDRYAIGFNELECAGCKWFAHAQIDSVGVLRGDGVRHAVGDILAGL